MAQESKMDFSEDGKKEDANDSMNLNHSLDMHKENKLESNLEHILDYKETPLFKTVKPLFLSMKLVGLYHTNKLQHRNSNGSKVNKQKLFARFTISSAYSIFVIIVLSVNLLRLIWVFDSNESLENGLLFKLSFTNWYLLCLINAIACYLGAARYHNIPEFFLKWNEICPKMEPKCHTYARNKSILTTFLCWFGVFINMGTSIYSVLFTNVLNNYLGPFTDNNSEIVFYVAKILFLIINIYCSTAWIFPSGLTYLISMLLVKEFTTFNENLKKDFNYNYRLCAFKLEKYRQTHQAICTLTGHADDFLNIHFAAAFLVHMANFTMLLYSMMITKDLTSLPIVLFMYIVWIVATAVFLGIDLVSACLVNYVVCKA